jgi:hypothetical protein
MNCAPTDSLLFDANSKDAATVKEIAVFTVLQNTLGERNVCPKVHDFGFTPRDSFIIMEHARGSTLTKLVRDLGNELRSMGPQDLFDFVAGFLKPIGMLPV